MHALIDGTKPDAHVIEAGAPTPVNRDALIAEAASLAWNPGTPVELRLKLIDFLAEHDESRFSHRARRSVVRERDWQAVSSVFNYAAERGWSGFERAALHRLAEPSTRYTHAERPERLWLAEATGRPPQDVAFEVFGGWDADATLSDRVAAWVALGRMVDPATRDNLLGFAMGSPAEELQAASQHVDVLPDTKAQVLILLQLSEPIHADLWTAASQTPLSDAQRQGLALRHLPAATQYRGQIPPDHAALAATLAGRLDHSPVERRESRALDADYSEAFADHRNDLAWGDLATIALLLGSLDQAGIAQLLFTVADLDRLDDSTELGGLLLIQDHGQRLEFRSYPPMFRGNDTRYVASDDLLADLPRALAHVHFHASANRNPEHAGPGQGDLAFARRFGVNAVVFTRLDRDTLNADFYTPDGTVIDLGVIRRP